ncbi:SAM-dependent methyltransferase [Pseudonocardia spinosispora]|uniref:SAM-dependent methyltransferase n=1 Tax=Pseudonocardia spinosispora TaxID=103441 RepID=UPI0003FABE2C|nr:SAM-dependent methyltransferase [Pseudonocardia spinosispora]
MTQKIFPRVYRAYFEYLYARHKDPWDYETDPYERDKYARTLEALGGRRFTRALDVGCSIGVLTALLAHSCDDLVAIDASALAIRRARRRLAPFSHVDVRRGSLPEDIPAGPFDLVVCSEVLYYFDEELLSATLEGLKRELAPGGVLLAVHGRFESKTCPLTGDEVHDHLKANIGLEHDIEANGPRFRLDLFRSPTAPGESRAAVEAGACSIIDRLLNTVLLGPPVRAEPDGSP